MSNLKQLIDKSYKNYMNYVNMNNEEFSVEKSFALSSFKMQVQEAQEVDKDELLDLMKTILYHMQAKEALFDEWLNLGWLEQRPPTNYNISYINMIERINHIVNKPLEASLGEIKDLVIQLYIYSMQKDKALEQSVKSEWSYDQILKSYSNNALDAFNNELTQRNQYDQN